MIKLLLILICLFVFFDVKSRTPPGPEFFDMNIELQRLLEWYPAEIISNEKCLKYYEKGKTITSWKNKMSKNYNRIDTFFVHKGKTYILIVNTRRNKNLDKNSPGVFGLSYFGCLEFDYEKNWTN